MKHIRKLIDWFFTTIEKAPQPQKPITRFELIKRRRQHEAAKRLIQK